MIEIPHEVLSEHMQERMHGRRVLHVVFTTFQFEPGFFEKEILPVFFDLNLSQAPVIRLVQLEDALRTSGARIAVYYDANGLITSDEGSAKLDIARIPVRHRTGIFHPKTIFALVEDTDPDENGDHPRALLIASMSANLTRAGWWKNVEACHVEELQDRQATRMREGLLEFIKVIRKAAPADVDHTALDAIREFVQRTSQAPHRSANGELRPHFYGGTQKFVEFLKEAAGDELRGLNLEIISPFFDQNGDSQPLVELIRAFKPVETRVFLPRNEAGDALVPEELYQWVNQQENVSWGALPGALTRTSNNDAAVSRNVHAKVYRFFGARPKREYLVIGSVNLSRPAHQENGNIESAILLQADTPRAPQFWLDLDKKKPKEFTDPVDLDGDQAASTAGSRLAIRFDWAISTAAAYWDDPEPSPALTLASGGVECFRLASVAPRKWSHLPDDAAASLRGILDNTSFIEVHGDRAHAVQILVLEEGMWRKPPMISRLTLQEILRYWSILSIDQRNEFIASRAAELLGDAVLNGLVTRANRSHIVDGIFERFAGIFHAFECRQKSITRALDAENEKEALYLLFGTKHDSLGSLLARLREEAERDLIDRYLIALCARQLVDEVRRAHRDFWGKYSLQAAELEAALAIAADLRSQLVEREPQGMPQFLAWFERRFLARAKSAEVSQ